MLISLLVPCYNAAPYIDQFIRHLSDLKKPFDEVIFYDDASKDNTASILEANGFKVIRGAVNKGPGFARNQLAAVAAGDYFHFHDIDDEMLPEYLEKTAQIAEKQQYDVVLCNVNWYDSKKEHLLFSWKYNNDDIHKNALSYTIANPIGGINGLYRKDKFMEVGGFDTEATIWEDADLHVKLAAANARFYVIEQVLCIAVRYHNSASANQVKGWLIRLEFLKSYFKKFADNAAHLAIGKQAQLAAANLIMGKQYCAAKAALQLSEKCGVKVPENNNAVWMVFKLIMPAWFRIELRMLQLKIAFRKTINGSIN